MKENLELIKDYEIPKGWLDYYSKKEDNKEIIKKTAQYLEISHGLKTMLSLNPNLSFDKELEKPGLKIK